jgi:hypothetical protein
MSNDVQVPPIRRVVTVHAQLLTFNPMTDPGVAGEPRGSSPKNAGLPRLPLISGAAIPVALVIFEALPVGGNFFYVVIGIPGLLLLWNAAAIWSAVLCVLNATRHCWRSAWVAAALPLVAAAAAFDIGGFVRGCNYAGDVLHFVVARPYYDRVIASLPAADEPRLAVFSWGGMSFASRGLVYDESDEVALPPGRRSAAWIANSHRAELACDGYSVRPLWSHFYLASFSC